MFPEMFNPAEEFAATAATYLDRKGGADHAGFWKFIEEGLKSLQADPYSKIRSGIVEALARGPSPDQVSKPQWSAMLANAARCDMVGPLLARVTEKPRLKDITPLLHIAIGIRFEGENCLWQGPISHGSIRQIADFMKKHEAVLGKSECARLVKKLDPIVNGVASSPFQGRAELHDTFQTAFSGFRT
ncbi:hypothetical protein [Lacisediminimonas sp.]|uniref:hypothetical protein n=1 Tax=Lacisediminimonas sp. TaxID=3060582 RepID=UPI002718C5DA|nr:hypothetical protein [Lacisediminimonas sp.]MDO8300780.1 hypothetical protein [Lacisediminimonas sp.]